MSKLKNISGFPEWLPEQKLVEDRLIARVRRIYESFGFTPIETPGVELLSTLSSKGEVDKEIYTVRRLAAGEDDQETLGLHFDLTVPFARYVAQHFNSLVFPFKRYQLQKVWRGERPQKGRFREFYQFDIDIIARDTLPLACDAEVISVLNQVFSELNAGKHTIRINNRKVLLGIYSSLGLSPAQAKQVVVAVDKVGKVGRKGLIKDLTENIGLELLNAEKIADLAEVKINPSEVEYILSSLDIEDKLFKAGKDELLELLAYFSSETLKNVQVDLSLARGLDYYTGVIVEVVLDDYPNFGSLASGGRYDDLASEFINKKLPGVGVSFGLTRFLDLAFSNKIFGVDAKTPAKVFVTVLNEEQRLLCNSVADRLRKCGVNTEVSFTTQRIGKQIDYADAKKIPFVLFVDAATGAIEVKDLASKEQFAVPDLEDWCGKLSA